MKITGTEAYETMLAHHRLLSEQLNTRVAAVSEAAAAGRPHEAAVAEVIAYLAEDVLPHAAAEEQTIYPAAAAHSDLTGTVGEMLAEHAALSAAAEELAGQADGAAAARQAGQIAELFSAHAARENEVLLPALDADSGTDLAALLAQMHRHAEEAAQAVPAVRTDRDPLRVLLGLLLEESTALARAGQADLACRAAAAAWAAVREDRPDLATTVTAALHGLTRRVTGTPTRSPAPPEGARGPAGHPGAPAAGPDLDVRSLPPAQRHETIFAAYHHLAPGAGFVLVNDHDPKPLRYQFEAEHAGEFSWESLEAGPEVWRVRIARPAAADPGSQVERDGGESRPGAAEPDLDVRRLVHFRRHDVIFTAYRALQPGAGFVLVNDHDPLPLRYQFEAQHGGEFTWDYLESGPQTWRVRIGRVSA